MSDCTVCGGSGQYCTNPEQPGALRIYAQCAPCVDRLWQMEMRGRFDLLAKAALTPAPAQEQGPA